MGFPMPTTELPRAKPETGGRPQSLKTGPGLMQGEAVHLTWNHANGAEN